MGRTFKILLLGLLLVPHIIYCQEEFQQKNPRSKHQISFSQGTDICLIAMTDKQNWLLGNNLKGGNADFAINYQYSNERNAKLIVRTVYTYNRDSYRFFNYHLDQYGPSKIKINSHLLSLEVGKKNYSKRLLTNLNFYRTFSITVSFSFYRRNDIYIPGQYHYQEFKDFRFSHVNLSFGRGIELATYKNQFFMTELGLDIPVYPLNNHTNLVYSLDFYFRVGYGFKF